MQFCSMIKGVKDFFAFSCVSSHWVGVSWLLWSLVMVYWILNLDFLNRLFEGIGHWFEKWGS